MLIGPQWVKNWSVNGLDTGNSAYTPTTASKPLSFATQFSLYIPPCGFKYSSAPYMEPHTQYSTLFIQGLYSLSVKTSYRHISWSLEAARLDVIMVVSLWHLTDISAALLPMCLSHPDPLVSLPQDFTRSCGKASVRSVNRGPDRYIFLP